jgi:hypothetical protein
MDFGVFFMTTIVNLRKHNCDIVCDRTSIFGNPYDYELLGITRDEACDRYGEYFKKKLQDPEFRGKVMELKGKRLGCWCVPLRCHLQWIVDYLENEPIQD